MDSSRVPETFEVQPLNGGQLIAAVPDVIAAAGWYVLVKLPGHDLTHPYVDAWVRTVDSPSWSIGHYHEELGNALYWFMRRASMSAADLRITDEPFAQRWLDTVTRAGVIG